MTVVLPAPGIRPLIESRPPCLSWRPVLITRVDLNQPTLDLGNDEEAEDGRRPSSAGVQVTLVRARWCAKQSPRLPDAGAWSTSLALALVEALHGHRSIAQLNRWVDDEVLAAIALHRRRRRAVGRAAAAPPVLQSVRVQHPHPEVAEVSAHVHIGRRSLAIAFRLEAAGERWLCTAAEFGPRHSS